MSAFLGGTTLGSGTMYSGGGQWWAAGEHGVWHYVSGSFQRCRIPAVFNGLDYLQRFAMPPDNAWMCPECREIYTREIVENG